MKLCVVYFSRSGNNKFLAQKLNEKLISSGLDSSLFEIKTKKSYEGKIGLLKCVTNTMINREIELDKIDIVESDFDLIIFTTPIWVGKIPGPIKSFVTTHCKKNCKYALLSISGGGSPKSKIDEHFQELLGANLELYKQFYITDSLLKNKKIDIKEIMKVKLDDSNFTFYEKELDSFVDDIKKINNK